MKLILVLITIIHLTSVAKAANSNECNALSNLLNQQRQAFNQSQGSDLNAYRGKIFRVIAVQASLRKIKFTSPNLAPDLRTYDQQLNLVIRQKVNGPLWGQLNAVLDMQLATLNMSLSTLISNHCSY